MRDEIIHSGPGYTVFHGREAGCFEIDGGIEAGSQKSFHDRKKHRIMIIYLKGSSSCRERFLYKGSSLSRWSDFLLRQRYTDWIPSAKGTVLLEPDHLKTRQMVLDNLQQLGIDANGNVPTLQRKHLAQHLEGARKAYLDIDLQLMAYLVIDLQLMAYLDIDLQLMAYLDIDLQLMAYLDIDLQLMAYLDIDLQLMAYLDIDLQLMAYLVIDLQLMYAACTTGKRIVSVNIQKDGIGLGGIMKAW